MDTVYVDLEDHDVLVKECQEAVWMGFTGKITIHPKQIDVVNAAFSPDPAAVEEAERLVKAFAEAKSAGLVTLNFEGKMVDIPHLARAQHLIKRAREIKQQLNQSRSSK